MKQIQIIFFLAIFLGGTAALARGSIEIKNSKGHTIISNKDIECLSMPSSKQLDIELTAGARRFFYEYTRDKTGESLETLVCGRQISNAKITAAISSGSLRVGNLEKTDRQCIKDFFKITSDCSACATCKTPQQMGGFTLSQIPLGSLYEKAGLKNQDIVKSINGQKLESAGQAVKLLQSLRNEKELKIIIERDGQEEDVHFKVE